MTTSDHSPTDDSTADRETSGPTTTIPDHSRQIGRRRLLEVGGAAISTALAGCSLLSRGGDDKTPTDGTNTEIATGTPTAYPEDGTLYEPDDLTEAPSYNDDREGTPRTNVQYGEKGTNGPLVVVFSDHAQVDTRDFWRDVGPELDTYVDDGRARVMEDFFPVVNKWSYVVPCTLYEIKHQFDDDAYWTYQEAVLNHYGSYSYDLLESLAGEVGADAERVRTAAEEGWRRPQVVAGKDAAKDEGIDYPPGVTVGFEPVEPTVEAITEAIENAE